MFPLEVYQKGGENGECCSKSKDNNVSYGLGKGCLAFEKTRHARILGRLVACDKLSDCVYCGLHFLQCKKDCESEDICIYLFVFNFFMQTAGIDYIGPVLKYRNLFMKLQRAAVIKIWNFKLASRTTFYR